MEGYGSFPIVNGFNNIRHMARRIRELRVPKVPYVYFRDQQNPLEFYNDEKFQANLAFSKNAFLMILDIFKDKLAKHTSNKYNISPLLRLTVFLQYMRSNEFYRSVSTQGIIQLPKSEVGIIVNEVAIAIASYSSTYIKVPSPEEQIIISSRIMEKYDFPGRGGTSLHLAKLELAWFNELLKQAISEPYYHG